MKRAANWRMGWVAAAMACFLGAGALALRAQDAEPTPAGESTPVQPRREASTSETPERQRLREIVNIGGSARVRADQVADEVVVVRGDAQIEGEVDGDVVVVLGKLTLTGTVRGSVVVVLGEADIRGSIRDEAVFVASPTHLHSNAVVRGDMVVVGGEPVIDDGASLRKSPTLVSIGPLMRYIGWARDYLFEGVFMLRPFPPSLGWVWAVVGIFLVFHLVLALLFNGALKASMLTLREQPARSFLVGLLICILSGPVSVLLSFTVVAVPLLGLLFMALSVFGRVAVYAATGAGVGRGLGIDGQAQPVVALLVGSVLYYVSYMVPVLGILVYWLVIPWGVGAVTICIYDSLRRERRPMTGLRAGSDSPAGFPGAVTGLAAGQPGPATHAVATPPAVEPTLGSNPSEPAAPTAGMGLPPFANPDSTAQAAAGRPPIVPLPVLDLAAAPRVAFWPRLAASLIDVLLVGFVNGMLSSQARTFWLLFAAYHLVMWVWKGTTLGGAVLGLRVIRLDGRPVDWQTAGVRVLGAVVSLLPLGLGFMWASWDPQVQSWHDRVAGTTVVKPPRGVTLV